MKKNISTIMSANKTLNMKKNKDQVIGLLSGVLWVIKRWNKEDLKEIRWEGVYEALQYTLDYNEHMERIIEEQKKEISALESRIKKISEAAMKVIIHYEFVNKGMMQISTGMYLIGKLKEALSLLNEEEK